MLCYRSSRSATDIIHDTFEWLTGNRRGLLPLLIPIIAVCAVCVPFMAISIDDVLYNNDPFWVLIDQLIPFSKDGSNLDRLYMARSMAAMAWVTTLLTVSVLRRYFIDRRSVATLTLKSAFSQMYSCIWQALPCALLTAVMFYFLEYSFNVWLIPLVIIVTAVVPCLITGTWSGLNLTGNLWHIVTSLFFITIVFCAVKALPAMLFAFLSFGTYLLNDLIPGIFSASSLMTNILTAVTTGLVCLSFCMAVAVYIVSALMLHGTIFSPQPHHS